MEAQRLCNKCASYMLWATQYADGMSAKKWEMGMTAVCLPRAETFTLPWPLSPPCVMGQEWWIISSGEHTWIRQSLKWEYPLPGSRGANPYNNGWRYTIVQLTFLTLMKITISTKSVIFFDSIKWTKARRGQIEKNTSSKNNRNWEISYLSNDTEGEVISSRKGPHSGY